MGSFQQVIVGGMLLAAAFFFGRFMTNQAPGSKPLAEAMEKQPDQLQLKATPLVAKSPTDDGHAVQRSLRDRILGERARDNPDQPQLPAQNDSAESKATESPPPDSKTAEVEIVVPDFSFLQQQLAAAPPLQPPGDQPARDIDPALEREFNPPLDLRPALESGQRIDDLPDRQTGVRTARFNIAAPPHERMVTQRGKIQPGKPARNMVPVDRRQNHLTLDDLEYVDYTTVFGDTLHSLSKRFFGTTDHYLDIYLANRAMFDDPSEVPVNTTIRIPVPRVLQATGQDRLK